VKPEELEECKQLQWYDEFVEAALKFDSLTMEDYREFS
jgi:hypothetical protein